MLITLNDLSPFSQLVEETEVKKMDSSLSKLSSRPFPSPSITQTKSHATKSQLPM